MEQKRYPHNPVFIVDDDPAWTNVLRLTLQKHLGVSNLQIVNDSRLALDAILTAPPALVLLDVTMPHVGGEQLLEQLKQQLPEVPIIMITGRSELELAVRCMKLGAYDYFIKTEEDERILGGIRRALELADLQQQNSRLKNRVLSGRLENPAAFSGVVTASRKMQSIFAYIEAIARSPEPVLIVGESGVGKELLARAVHQTCCPTRPWVPVNVAGLDDNAFSDTLFGHIRGAFTGADRMRQGLIEKARGGVLFLDEIGDLQPESQVKLLRLLQEREYYPLGSDQAKRAEVRMVFATNHDLLSAMDSGRFRQDLYYRLRSHQLVVPPLRERPEDIPLLLGHYLQQAAEQVGKPAPQLPAPVAEALAGYRFPGNIRELRALLFDAVSNNGTGSLTLKDFSLDLAHLAGAAVVNADPVRCADGRPLYPDRLPTIKQGVRMLVEEALLRAGSNRAVAARLLGISQAALSKRLKNIRAEDTEGGF